MLLVTYDSSSRVNRAQKLKNRETWQHCDVAYKPE